MGYKFENKPGAETSCRLFIISEYNIKHSSNKVIHLPHYFNRRKTFAVSEEIMMNKQNRVALELFQGAEDLGGGSGFLNDKGHTLSLPDVIKSQTSDESSRIRLLALGDFMEDLRCVRATKHRKLPQCPVPPIVVVWDSAILTINIPQLYTKKVGNNKLVYINPHLMINFTTQTRTSSH